MNGGRESGIQSRESGSPDSKFPLTNTSVRQTLRDLLAATAECVRAESEAKRLFAEQMEDAQRAHDDARIETQRAWEIERDTLTREHQDSRQALEATLDAKEKAIETEFATTSHEILLQYDRDEATTTKEHQETGWTADAIFDAAKKQAKEKLDSIRRACAEQRTAIAEIREKATDRLQEWNQAAVGNPATTDGNREFTDARSAITAAREQLAQLNKLVAPRLLLGDRVLLMGVAVALVMLPLLFLLSSMVLNLDRLKSIGISVGGAFVIGLAAGIAIKMILAARARRGVQAACQPLFRALAEAATICQQTVTAEEATYTESKSQAKDRLLSETKTSEKSHRQKLSLALQQRDAATREATQKREKDRVSLTEQRKHDLTHLDAGHMQRTAAMDASHSGALQRITDDLATKTKQAREQFDAEFTRLSAQWKQEYGELSESLQAIAQQNAKCFPAWPTWQPPKTVPPSLRFGDLAVTLPARPSDPKLQSPPAEIRLPALSNFPQQSSTLLHASGAARPTAAQALLSMAVRYLTALPPGKVRLTIVDPVNLGENFAALMRLGDDDPQLVGGRIWTEQPQIEKRLADLTAHMENVIQKYLRNQYASIEEYNQSAGEVAEPYRVLVVANFPANFSSEAARRLERIAASGASCGVYTLVSYDNSLPMPQGFQIDDLVRASLNLYCKDGTTTWDDSDFGKWPLAVDAPPPQNVLQSVLDRIGKAAKDANRVEVDFAFIAPPKENRWTGDSRSGIDVALGRAGATKRQHLRLGQGTAQHVVVAGKTGSGKSTLLHALITNLALTYGPEEIELYLIDFKKGVEFKTYATHLLPHARVIAVESEREFGLSVLQRLDTELKRRGEMYRQAGVQDVKSFRDSAEHDTSRLPRILLIVDEFQEFFVEDDRVAQEAALLLDRLVRQGRAFGLHVLLGSQTLGGAYSLARSTIDQMAVRIALQCSEADAGLILSKDNSAARLLSRPGEAIYNDANGLIEGNDIFQVVWLPDERREEYLIEIRQSADQRGYLPPAPTVVFEGNVPSDMTGDEWFHKIWVGPPPKTPPREVVCRLGDAMAIKAPTAAVFRRQSTSNLLILGQQPEPARALTLAITVAALGQQPRAGHNDPPRVVLLDGTPADDIHAGYFSRALSGFAGLTIDSVRDAATTVETVWAEYERRTADPSNVAPSLLFVVYGLHRIKDFRKAEEDYGFRREGGPNPAQRFTTLLREGPAVGIHIVAWCDTLLNAQRAFERAALREFEMKVLFQMSANDSSTLIDSPLASRLGVNRALFAHEELTAPEKFRPYSLPPDEWLESLKAQQKTAGEPVTS